MNNTLQITSASLDKPTELINMAATLKQFITENRLFTLIQGKQYVNVEGWQYAAACIGIVPVIEETQDISNDEEIKYRTSVKLIRLSDGMTVGSGVAICASSEPKRRNSAEYVIASMSQTRAIGKAFRNTLAWVITAAGYAATPAEEMDASEASEAQQAQKQTNTQGRGEGGAKQPAMATTAQKTKIVSLLNHDAVAKADKEKMITVLPQMTEARAEEAISKIEAQIRKFDIANH